jgi:hypothetical protein
LGGGHPIREGENGRVYITRYLISFKKKMNNIRKFNNAAKPLRGQGRHAGFAMVVALVIMTAVFVMVGSLATTRQMWGFFSTKQLDRSFVDLTTRADSANWFLQNRVTLLRNKQIQGVPILLTNLSFFPTPLPDPDHNPARLEDLQYAWGAPSLADVQPFPPVRSAYPDYDTNIFSLTMDYLFTPRTNEVYLATPQGSYDPYFGITNYGQVFGVVFKREMDDGLRESRQNRFDENLTQLRAWASIDAALLTDVVVRRFPLSSFTLYAVSSASTSYSVPVDSLISPLNAAYSHAGYSVGNVGIGRVYIDGAANFNSNTITLGFPIVANRGFINTAGVNLFYPDYLGGGNRLVNASPSNYKKNRYFVYQGMLASSYDRPQRLISMHQRTNQPFLSKPITDIIQEGYVDGVGSVAVKLELNTNDTNNVVTLTANSSAFDGAIASQRARIESTNIWIVDHDTKAVTLRITNGYFDSTNFTQAPTSILFRLVGTNAGLYTFSVDVPSVGALSSDPNRQKLSIVTPNPLTLGPNGFNSDFSGTGSMLMSPDIRIPGATGSSVNIGGVVATRQVGTNRIFTPVESLAGVNVNIRGSLQLFSVNPNPGLSQNTTISTTVTPDINYLTANSIPPSTLTGLDFRIKGEEIRTYTMRATGDPVYEADP